MDKNHKNFTYAAPLQYTFIKICKHLMNKNRSDISYPCKDITSIFTSGSYLPH